MTQETQDKGQRRNKKPRVPCFYCGRQVREGRVDHVHPRSKGGSNDDFNLVPCCRYCNSRKGDKSVDELRGHIGQRSMRAAARLADMLEMGYSEHPVLSDYAKELRLAVHMIQATPVKFYGECEHK